MNCRHCGREFPNDAKYCPYCAEPTILKNTASTPKEKEKRYNDNAIFVGLLWFLIVAYISWRFLVRAFGDTASPLLLIPFFVVPEIICIICVAKYYGNKRRKTILMQYQENQMAICPQCGSHNIKVYRKGYNYHTGFWGAIFGVRGAGYAGGFDANKACCRCMNCGKDWETDYDYRLVK